VEAAHYVEELRQRIADLEHEKSRLEKERQEFERRAARINGYVRKYDVRGFRAGAMYRKQDWYDVFKFSYDMSVPNVAHLEPKRGGCCTVMPFFIGNILELPLTLAQDYSLFHILDDYSLGVWQQQLALIRERHGLMSFITHPDYLIDDRARAVYVSLLAHLKQMVAQDSNNSFARYGLGMEYANAGEFSQAVEEFRALIERDRDYAAAYFRRDPTVWRQLRRLACPR